MKPIFVRLWMCSVVLLVPLAVRADGPKDNLPDNVRRIPQAGIAVPAADRAQLEAGVAELGQEIESLRSSLKTKPALLDLLPDVQIYHNAVRYALAYNEFFKPAEIKTAKTFLKQGMDRAKALRDGKAPWTAATGLVVRGYVSHIDGSVQPYGLVVPSSYQPGLPYQHRLDLWFHGRGETLSELNFIDGRQKSPGEFTPPHAFVLHPYGRYSNANKFAGEIDTFEAMAHVKKHYPIDENRIVARGFSMGGAACWQFAVHYPSVWAAAAPGAGFAETADFLKVFQDETLKPTWYEQKLWHLYDSTDYAVNLFNCPVVAYSGEIDRQKQAADMMAKALDADGIKLAHIIGPQTAHKFHPQAKEEINRRIDAIVSQGRDPVPANIRFTTWTLRYNKCCWLTVDSLEEHWKRAGIIVGIEKKESNYDVYVYPDNITAFTLSMPSGSCSLQRPFIVWVRSGLADKILYQVVHSPPPLSDRSWMVHARKVDGRWQAVESADDGTLRKRHGLQGPIDDAFMDSFVMVRPTGKPLNDKVGEWVSTEMAHAVEHWRRQFRGEARVKNDDAVSKEDIAGSNLVLWGDPSSNKVLAQIADKLPIRWDKDGVHVGAKTYASANHVPVLIYPNPLNPKRYVVLNSGFTYREYDYLNNARQVPKLPDYAVIDVNVPPTSRAPGGIVAAGFFGERWELTGEPK